MLIAVTLLATGCGSAPRRAGMEISGREGTWKLTGVDRAALKQDGWVVYIYDTEVSDINLPPRLEKFVLEIANTDETRPLYIEPGEIWLTGLNNQPLQLVQNGRRVLGKDQSWSVLFDEGAHTPPMPHPFSMTITVFRGPNFKKPETVVITLY